MSYIFDIETGPLEEEVLRERMPTFDPGSVKCGNLKDPDKIEAKIEGARKEHERLWFERAALSARTGRVLAIGVSCEDEGALVIGDERETDVLNEVWGLATNGHGIGSSFIGFNIHAFDLPFLVRRSWLIGVSIPDWILERGRYWHPTFVDLLEVWRLGNRSEYISLDELAKALGLPGKPDGVTGADFHRLWHDDRDAAIAYLKNDLEMIARIADALQVV